MLRPRIPLLLLSVLFLCSPAYGADDGVGIEGVPSRAGEIRRGMVMGASSEERTRLAWERAARKVEPSLKGEIARLPAYLEFFNREFVEDVRTFAFDVSASASADGALVLSGHAEYPEHRDALRQFLTYLGFKEIDDRIELLPAGLGESPFGLVKAPHAFLYDKTAKPRETVSQALLGDPLFLLRETADGNYLCHSAEGYLGYIAVADVHRVGAKEFSASQALPRAAVIASTEAAGIAVPAGAHLPVVKSDDEQVTVALPGGAQAVLPAGRVQVLDEETAAWRTSPVIAAARRFLGTKYVWGGKSLDGIDCSGLVQVAYQTHGIRLPRDADQQAYVGQLVATRWHRADLRAGDTLYFLSRRGQISHTALYAGNNTFIEASGPGVKITSFDPASPLYEERRVKSFCFAKRILD